MGILVLTLIAPWLLALILICSAKIYKIQYPSPLVFGCMIPKVCPVVYQQIADDINKLDQGEKPVAWRLRREARRKDLRVNWLYLCQEAANTNLFLRTLRFEKLRIDPKKSGLNYEDRELL